MEQYDANGLLKPEFVKVERILGPEGWMENPYIGKDGRFIMIERVYNKLTKNIMKENSQKNLI